MTFKSPAKRKINQAAEIGASRTVLLVAVFLAIAVMTGIGLQLTNRINVKEWQTLIGFGGTLFVGWIAWANVNRQLKVQRSANRMTVLIREEDRIDRELPGLRATERLCHELFYCAKLAREYDADKNILTKRIIDVGITGTTDEEIEKQIALILPGSDNPTRAALAMAAAIILSRGESEEKDRLVDKVIEGIEGKLQHNMSSIALRIGRLEGRQELIRRSIDDFFGDE